MLCIAAEITAALLLLAFAIPEKKKIAQPDGNSEELDRLSIQAKQYCVDAAVFRGLAILRDPTSASFHDSEEMAENLKLVGYEDKLTHTANHAFADAFLSKWLRLAIDHRTGSSLAMIVVDDYSDLLRAKGAMELEAILRKLSEMIKAEFGSTSIISRYQPDRFLIVSFNGDIGRAYTGLIALRKQICDIVPDESTGHGAFDCTNSIVHLGEEDVNLQQAIEDLDEGISQASSVSGKCVAKSPNQEWSDSAPVSTSLRDHDSSRKADKQTGQSSSQSTTTSSSSSNERGREKDSGTGEEPSETTAVSGDGSSVPTAPEKVVADTPVAKETRPQSDVQAVAKNEDIEALFAQINKNKKSNASTTEEPSKPSPQNTANETPAVSEVDASESATADDIAALFATVKGATQPSSPKPAEAPTKPTPDAIDDENGAASADDIAALFASAQNAPKAQQAPAKAPAATTPAVASPTPSTASENLDEAASADDIAALFASVQSAPKQQTPAKAPTATTPAPTPPTPSTALENLDEAASADDIAALFASVQNAPKPQPATVKAPATTTPAPTPSVPSAALENLDEAASADDIASLFAMAKSGKPEAKPPAQPIAAPTPVSTPSNAANSGSEDLNEAASANDIAALFAAAKKPTPSSNSTGETADKSNPPPIHETPEGKKNIEALVQNLNESASADEIEALFANLK